MRGVPRRRRPGRAARLVRIRADTRGFRRARRHRRRRPPRSRVDSRSAAASWRLTMPHYRHVGDVPRKRHSYVPTADGYLFEELMGHEGFAQESSLLYHRHSPSAIVAVEAVDDAPVTDDPRPSAAAAASPHRRSRRRRRRGTATAPSCSRTTTCASPGSRRRPTATCTATRPATSSSTCSRAPARWSRASVR